MEDYYDLLGLNGDASDEAIDEAINSGLKKWRKRVNAPDPQKQREASEKMEALQEAREILLDPVKREEYDHQLREAYEQQGDDTIPNEVDPHDESTSMDPADELIQEATALINQDNYADAIVVATKATEVNGNHPYAWEALAKAHFFWKEYGDALYEIKRAINLLPNEDFFYYIAFLCQYNRQDLKKSEKLNLAEEFLEKALHIKPDNPTYMEESASIAQERGKINKAINILKKVEKNHGLSDSARGDLGTLYYNRGLSQAQKVNFGRGRSDYYFTDRDSTLKGKDDFSEASKYVQNNSFKDAVNHRISQANDALSFKNRYKILALFILIVPLFFNALVSFNFIMIVFMAAAGYFTWKYGRVPKYELNRKYINSLR
ncbi:hypothetical protein GCM10028778_21220 [Barrientosiimonas marina]|uniref:DnaJ domain-containing protein n=1 Tax=Lentibacillus kimchii TaxID=1542911 RepID=A0ABW2UU85_9BACI